MTENMEVVKAETGAVARPQPTAIDILQAAIEKGITAENVAVVREIKQMVREEREDAARVAFNRAFFALRKEMPVVYADREVKTDSGALAFQYCSPQEIKDVLEPLMMRHGFTTMTSQQMDGDSKVTVTVTLMHESGHSCEGTFTIRVGQENRLVKGPQVVAGATTAAERHCLIKLFGLRTRINPEGDARNLGTHITPDQAADLERRVHDTGSDVGLFLKFAGARTFAEIMSSRYAELDQNLRRKEKTA
jgi:ERF superfamily